VVSTDCTAQSEQPLVSNSMRNVDDGCTGREPRATYMTYCATRSTVPGSWFDRLKPNPSVYDPPKALGPMPPTGASVLFDDRMVTL